MGVPSQKAWNKANSLIVLLTVPFRVHNGTVVRPCVMPVQFLTQADHEQLNRCPDDVSAEELNRFFWLTPAEHDVIGSMRHDYNRLGFALQLGCLRYLGFFPANLPELPRSVVE
jgi:hypothetical protein